MQSTMMILTTLLASGALAFPTLGARAQLCNQAPTGPTRGASAPISQLSTTTAELCHQECEADGRCQSFVFGLPPSAEEPECMLFSLPGPQVPGQESGLHVFDKGCSGVPTGRPTKQDPFGDGSAPSHPQAGHHQRDAGSMCGAAPTGPTGSSPVPLSTNTDVPSEKACLVLCRKTAGCKAVEFGKPSAKAAHECRLFKVAAASLPASGSGQGFTVSDSGC